MSVSGIKSALGKIKADLVIKNARIVNVFSHSIEEGDVAVLGGRIIGVGEYDGKTVYDAQGRYVMPAFIDAHVHIESSMLTPAEYAKAVVPKGVTTVIADPHEIANACGEEGLKYMFAAAKGLPLDIRYMMPSCVPASKNDVSNAAFDGKETKRLLNKYPFHGLGEMMDSVSVLNADKDVLNKIAAAKIVDGHAPMLRSKGLNAYLNAGIRTDHECTTAEEAAEKVARGMYVLIREGTSARNLDALIKAVNGGNMRRFCFCTDDKHLNHIQKYGTVSNCVKKAVADGLDPIDTITMATLNAAEAYGIEGKGAIGIGYYADLIVSNDITAQQIERVYGAGKLIAEKDKALFEGVKADDKAVRNTVKIKEFSEKDFTEGYKEDEPMIGVCPNTLVTDFCTEPIFDGDKVKCAVVERYGRSGNVGKCFVSGFALESGAVAQSIGHDSHNIVVIGRDEKDMAAAVNALNGVGGIAVADGGKVVAKMLLPVAGLISDLPYKQAIDAYAAVKKEVRARTDGSTVDTLMMMSFLPLSVIPSARITERGLFDVNKQIFLNENA